ncbi:hypothetical protein Peur_024318 [Populus x canadensis]
MTSDTPACFTNISPADVAVQIHGDSTPARHQLQQQYDTSITQPETFQQEIVHTSSSDITNSAAVQSLYDLSNSGSPTDPYIEPSSSLQHHSPENDIQQVAAPTQQEIAHNLCPDISQQPLSENLTTLQQQDHSNLAPHSMVTRSQHALHQAAQPPCGDALQTRLAFYPAFSGPVRFMHWFLTPMEFQLVTGQHGQSHGSPLFLSFLSQPQQYSLNQSPLAITN